MTRIGLGIILALALVAQPVRALKRFQQPSRLYQVGERTFNIPPSAQRQFQGFEVVLTREAWPLGVNYTQPNGVTVANSAVVVRFERTLDDGATWQPFGGAVFPGGILIHPRTGLVVTENRIRFGFVDASGPVAADGDLRLTVETLVALRTAITATMLEGGETFAVK